MAHQSPYKRGAVSANFGSIPKLAYQNVPWFPNVPTLAHEHTWQVWHDAVHCTMWAELQLWLVTSPVAERANRTDNIQ